MSYTPKLSSTKVRIGLSSRLTNGPSTGVVCGPSIAVPKLVAEFVQKKRRFVQKTAIDTCAVKPTLVAAAAFRRRGHNHEKRNRASPPGAQRACALNVHRCSVSVVCCHSTRECKRHRNNVYR